MASGWNSWISFGEESVYGTAPGTVKGYGRIVTDGANVDDNPYQAPGLGQRSIRGFYQGVRTVDLPFEVETGYEGAWQYLLKHALGAYGFTANTGGVTGYNKHTFSASDTMPVGMTIEISKGDIGTAGTGNNKVFLYTGCKVNTLELSLEQDSLLRCNAGIIARNEAPDTTRVGAPSYPTLRPIKNIHHTAVVVAGSAAAVVSKVSLKIDNKMDRYFNLGRFTSEPSSSEPQEISLEGEMRLDDLAIYNKFLAGTTGTLNWTMESDTNENPAVYVTGTSPYKVSVDATVSFLVGETPKISGAGIITVPFKAQCIGTQPVATVTIYNGAATL